MEFIDTHAHIYLSQFDEDRSSVIERIFDNSVKRIYMPNIDHASIDSMMEAEEKYPDTCFAMMGLHPCSVKKDFQRELYIVEEWLQKRKFKAVGEAGIDLYWDTTFQAEQEEALRIQVEWAKKYNLPLILHTRNSFDETFEVISENQAENLTGIFHCFSGTLEEARKVIEVGFFVGIGGTATFKNGLSPEVIKEIPLGRMVLETDSPYLAPVPHRGKRNEPAYIPLVAEKIAEIKAVGIDEIAAQTTQNALNLFENTDE